MTGTKIPLWRQAFTTDDPRGPWPGRAIVQAVDQLREFSAASDDWEELCHIQDHEFDPDSPTRFEVGARMAELLESHADRIERSGLVRAFATTFTPADLRAEAAEYRAGRDPHA